MATLSRRAPHAASCHLACPRPLPGSVTRPACGNAAAVPRYLPRRAARVSGEAAPVQEVEELTTITDTEGSLCGPVDWLSAWYPIAFTKDLDQSKLFHFTLLAIPLVVWWDAAASAWHVLEDKCPHRLVPLSEGRINQQGQLECGYHGWSFRGDGSCTRIPQGGNIASPRACATAFPCEERQGLLFVYPRRLVLSKGQKPGDQGGWPDPNLITTVPELEDPTWVAQDTWRDLPYDFSILMENVLDSSHVPFTHHKSMSNRNVVNNYNIQLSGPIRQQGFTGLWKDGPRAGTLGPQSTEFRFPGYMKHKIESPAVDNLVIVYAVPTKPGRCRLINRNAVKVKTNAGLVAKLFRLIPRWMIHMGTQTLLEDDQIFLHEGEVRVAARKAAGDRMAKAYFTPSPADTYVLAFHRWLADYGGGGPFGPVDREYLARLGPRLSRDQLLDRFSQHTATCASCQRGMAQVTSLINVLSGVEQALYAAAMLCFATAASSLVLLPAAGQQLSAAASLPAGSAASPLAALLLSGLSLLVGSQPSVEQLVMRGAAFAMAALASGCLASKASEVKARFITGVYPPPRNIAKD